MLILHLGDQKITTKFCTLLSHFQKKNSSLQQKSNFQSFVKNQNHFKPFRKIQRAGELCSVLVSEVFSSLPAFKVHPRSKGSIHKGRFPLIFQPKRALFV